MPKPVLRPRPETRASLVAALEEARVLAGRDEIDPVALGKALAAIMLAARTAFVESGVPSVRMEAAVRALDLTTPKGVLEDFARR